MYHSKWISFVDSQFFEDHHMRFETYTSGAKTNYLAIQKGRLSLALEYLILA